MEKIGTHKERRSIKRLIIFTSILFLVVYSCNWPTTAAFERFTLSWTIVTAFIKSYIAVVSLYFGFSIWEKVSPDFLEDSNQLQQCFLKVLQRIQLLFLVAISLQILINLASLWQELKLWPLELEFWESVWTLVRYTIGLFGTWVLEFWFWMGKQLRISFLLNNPCVGGICLEEYPWLSLVLTAMFGYTLKQLWKITFIRGVVRFGMRIVYGIIRVIGKYVLFKVSKKAAAHLSSSLFLSVSKQTLAALQGLYQLPEKKETLLPSSEKKSQLL